MKKLILLFLTVAAVFISSCTLRSNTTQTEGRPVLENTNYTIEYLYPFNENVHLKYAGKGNEYASQEVYVDYIKDNRIQLRIINGGTTIGQVLEVSSGTLSKIYSREEFYYKDDITDMKAPEAEILLKEPIAKGTSWLLPDGRTRRITGVDVNVATPSGIYKAVEVTTEQSDSGSKLLTYYAKGIGMVKQVFYTGDVETVSTSLQSIEKNTPVKQTIKFYYPDVEKSRIVFVKKNISLLTNSEVKPIIESFLKVRPGIEISYTLPEASSIEKLYYDSAKQMAILDLNKDFVKNINAGASVEGMILTSLANTIGDYYNTSKVYITIGGQPYSSGHILMEKDEPFLVNYSNSVEYK